MVGPRGVCRVADMPEPRQGHTAGVLGDTVYVCGGTSGKHIHERWIKNLKLTKNENSTELNTRHKP